MNSPTRPCFSLFFFERGEKRKFLQVLWGFVVVDCICIFFATPLLPRATTSSSWGVLEKKEGGKGKHFRGFQK